MIAIKSIFIKYLLPASSVLLAFSGSKSCGDECAENHYHSAYKYICPHICVVTFYSGPHFHKGLGAVSAVVHHSASFDYGSVRVHHRVQTYAVRLVPEEIRRVKRSESIRIFHLFKNLISADSTYIAYHVHIADGILRLAEEIDEIAGCLDVLGIFRDEPSVKPYRAAFLRNGISEFYPCLRSFIYCPLGVSAP